MQQQIDHNRIRYHLKKSTKRKIRRRLLILGEICHSYKKYIIAALAVFFVMLTLFYYVKWLNYQSFNQLKQYIEEMSETSETSDNKAGEGVKQEDIEYMNYKNIFLDVQNIPQKPELPTGCEITSLAILLNYLHPEKGIDKVTLADEYLEMGKPGMVSPDEKFVGNPHHTGNSFGANAPVLVKSAEKYYAENMADTVKQVKNLTGTEFKELLAYVIDGYPVMIWATINMLEPYTSIIWTIDGKEVPWQAQFHCMVLIGFDFEKEVYYIADPLKEGITEYNVDLLEKRYEQIGQQAIVIY